MSLMRAAAFVEPASIVLDDKPIPDVGPRDALIRVTTTTICGTDVHILKGEYPVARGLTIGGSSATPSTAARQSTCWCPTRWPTSRRCPTN